MLEHADHWTPPDSLGYSSLRPVRLTGLGLTLAIFAAATLIGGVVLGVMLDRTARRQNVEQSLLRAQGLPTDATVTRAWPSMPAKGAAETLESPIISSMPAAAMPAARKSPRIIWRDLAEGALLPVRFVPSQPSISHPIAWASKHLPIWVAVLDRRDGRRSPS